MNNRRSLAIQALKRHRCLSRPSGYEIAALAESSPPARARPQKAPLEYRQVLGNIAQGTGKTHLSIALGIRACLAGHRVAFRTATEWVALLADVQRQGRLDQALDRLGRVPLLILDEVGYIPFDPQAANLTFMLVSRRYERASLIVTSNKIFSAWGETLGDVGRLPARAE